MSARRPALFLKLISAGEPLRRRPRGARRIADFTRDEEVDLNHAADQISRSVDVLKFEAFEVAAAVDRVEELKTRETRGSADKLFAAFSSAVDRNWATLSADLIEEVATRVHHHNFLNFLSIFPTLASDARLLPATLKAVGEADKVDAATIERLSHLSGNSEALRYILEQSLNHRLFRTRNDALLQLIFSWSEADAWFDLVFVLFEHSIAHETGDAYWQYRSGATDRAAFWETRAQALNQASKRTALRPVTALRYSDPSRQPMQFF